MKRFVFTVLSLSATVTTGRAFAEPVAQRGVMSARLEQSRAKSATVVREVPARGDKADSSFVLLLDTADADSDARVTSAELEALVERHVTKQVTERFQRLDRNADGSVTRDEVPRMDPARFQRLDRNADGRITPAELGRVMHEKAVERCHSVFARLDVDHDGTISSSDREGAELLRVSLRAAAPARR